MDVLFAGFDVGAASYPVAVQYEGRNVSFEADDGTLRVRGVGIPSHTRTYKFKRLTASEKFVLELALLGSAFGANGAAVIAFTDDEAQNWNGRPWIKKLKFEQRLGRYWSASVTMRIEGGFTI